MGILDWLFKRSKRKPDTTIAKETSLGDHRQPQASSKEVEELIERLRAQDEDVRYKAAMELYRHPEPATVNALIDALKDRSSRVRGCAAESLRVIAVARSCSVDPNPILDALRNEPEDSEALHYIMGALRHLGAGVAAEQLMEQRRKAQITSEGGPLAQNLQEIDTAATDLWSGAEKFETAFASLFSDLMNENPEVRREVSRKLEESPKAREKLISVYHNSRGSDPLRSVVAGRVLGRKIDAGKQQMIHAQTSSIAYGIDVAFTPCVCGHCGKLNVGIPIPEGGLYTPFYGQEDDQNCAYSLPVLCDHCGKVFFIAWDSDPR